VHGFSVLVNTRAGQVEDDLAGLSGGRGSKSRDTLLLGGFGASSCSIASSSSCIVLIGFGLKDRLNDGLGLGDASGKSSLALGFRTLERQSITLREDGEVYRR